MSVSKSSRRHRLGRLAGSIDWVAVALVMCGVSLVAPATSAQDFGTVEIKATPLRDGLHMLTGRGGNVVVSAGVDGVLVIDDQYAPLAPKIRKAVAAIDKGPIRFVVNTHWHGDHTGGNEALAGEGAVIVAHDNVRRRMSTEQFMAAFDTRVPPSPKAALPVVTFDTEVTLHFNGDTLRIVHPPPAHTDGDALIRFEIANVVHGGDVFFSGMYPFFDASSGGGFAGMIEATEQLLTLTDAETILVPGHGPLARRPDLLAYRDMLVDVRDTVSAEIGAGKTRSQIVAGRPTRAHDPRFGGGFMKPDSFVALVYESLVGSP